MKTVKSLIGLSSVDEQVNEGVEKVENLLDTIKETKSSLLGLISGGIYKKTDKIVKLEIEVLHLKGLKDAVENLG